MNKTLLFLPVIIVLSCIPARGEEGRDRTFHFAMAQPALEFKSSTEIQRQYSLKSGNQKWEPLYTGMDKGMLFENTAYMKNESFFPYITKQNIHEPLVGTVALDFSQRRTSRFSRSSMTDFLPTSAGDIVMTGAAFLTNLAVHEFGHAIVADHVGVSTNRLEFFNKEGEQFFLGTSRVEDIDKESILPYTMGGEFFADITFEHALQSYRKKPNGYNKALLLCSGTDFLLYSLYAFYLTGGHETYDPSSISKETGLSEDTLFSIVLAKTALNAYRIFSGNDVVIPYFTVDKNSAVLNLAIPF